MSASVIHHQQNQCMRRFHEAGAINSQTVATLEEIGVIETSVLQYLQSRGVVVNKGAGWFHIDLEAEQEFRHRRTVFTVSLLAVVLAILIVVLLATINT